MTKKQLNDINKVVKDSLPTLVAGELKTRLEEADQLEKRCEDLQRNYDFSIERITELQTQITRESNLEDGEANVEKMAAILKIRSKDLDNRELILKLKEDHAAEKVALMKDNFDTVFRNTTVRTKALQVVPDSYSNPDGQGGTMSNTIHSTHEVTSETEEG